MPNSFAITTTTNSLQLNNQRRGEAVFSVFNASGRAIRGRARLTSENAAAKAWLSLTGAAERDFAMAGIQQFNVQIAVPPDAPAGNYTFGLDMIGVENPDEDLTEGPTVTFQVAAPEVKKPFPWWIVAVIAGLLVLGVAAIVILSQPKTAIVPDLTGLAVTEAEAQLKDAGLEAGQTQPRASNTVAIGQIIGTAPAANQEVNKGTRITLIVSTGPSSVSVPNVAGLEEKEATIQIRKMDLKVGDTLTESNDTVPVKQAIRTDPAAGTRVAIGSAVKLIISSGPQLVRVPKVIDLDAATAVNRIFEAGLFTGSLNENCSKKPKGIIISSSPKESTRVAKGSKVDLVASNGFSPGDFRFCTLKAVPIPSNRLAPFLIASPTP
jgi:eukaryotic-like serine/threonine-protein kinase